MKKVRIETYGCQMNVADSEVVAAMMELAGYVPTDVDTEAAAVLCSTPAPFVKTQNRKYIRASLTGTLCAGSLDATSS